DQTYMSEPTDIEEYVENDNGFIYLGTKNQIQKINWCFSQYENDVLTTAYHLMDLACLAYDARNDMAKIVRAICSNITSCEDSGVISGNWSCSHAPYTAPTQWLGTLPIVRDFLMSKEPTKYGHCYVFAALATSLCRSLGIPCRCVTSYASAHDCDGINKVNLHWGIHGEPIDVLNTLNCWTFHVWCEAYLKRPELLLNSYNGWQAFDPTPQ
ncbi:hypothetical protein HELRODRAFT_124807, partial [Helobdella robusta]|uniref:Transglutaminase-like domain-containing protein n=1 Tax=Helobdella robusta TaxID=6412 RepID=T1EH30_HELRO